MPLADPPSSNHVQGPSVLDFASSSTSQQQQEQHDQGKEAPTLAGQEERLGQDEIQPATENVAAANMHLDPPHSARTSDRRLYDPEKNSLPASNHYYPVSDHDSRLDAQHHQIAMRGLKKDLGALVGCNVFSLSVSDVRANNVMIGEFYDFDAICERRHHTLHIIRHPRYYFLVATQPLSQKPITFANAAPDIPAPSVKSTLQVCMVTKSSK